MNINALEKPSLFIQKYMPLFLERFNIFYTRDDDQIQYCIHEKKSRKDISCSIELEMDEKNKHVNILMFYPGLELLPDTHYFSSVCFYLVIHHFTRLFDLSSQYSLYLKTKESIFDDFYSKFFDFHFTIDDRLKGKMLYTSSLFHPTDIDVSMIIKR